MVMSNIMILYNSIASGQYKQKMRIDMLESTGKLRGRGGAGFPTGLKWSSGRFPEEKAAADRRPQIQWQFELSHGGGGGNDGTYIQEHDRLSVPARGISCCAHREPCPDQKKGI